MFAFIHFYLCSISRHHHHHLFYRGLHFNQFSIIKYLFIFISHLNLCKLSFFFQLFHIYFYMFQFKYLGKFQLNFFYIFGKIYFLLITDYSSGLQVKFFSLKVSEMSKWNFQDFAQKIFFC